MKDYEEYEDDFELDKFSKIQKSKKFKSKEKESKADFRDKRKYKEQDRNKFFDYKSGGK